MNKDYKEERITMVISLVQKGIAIGIALFILMVLIHMNEEMIKIKSKETLESMVNTEIDTEEIEEEQIQSEKEDENFEVDTEILSTEADEIFEQPEVVIKETEEIVDIQYDKKDANKDGEVSEDEVFAYITPEKQACIDAGYGVVVELHGGEMYAVLMKSIDHTIDGKDGGEILHEYLHEHNLRGDVGGRWINPDKEWYWYTADEIEYYE